MAALLAVPAAAAAAGGSYAWPVPAEPIRGFDAPPSPYAAGHRGVDLPVVPGEVVRPMAPGTVAFAGTVAGNVWVTVRHLDGVRTSYGPLQPGTHVRAGWLVDRATVLGRARGDGHGRTGSLHVGARLGDRYLDPATLVDGRQPMVATLVGPGQAEALPGPADARPTLVEGAPPSPNHLVVLSGLTSRTGEVPFDLEALGYGPSTWQQYSYVGVDADGQPAPYAPDATWGRVHDMALALRDQLRVHADRQPAQAVDLVGHSLGGLVGLYYLLVLHDATDPTLPPIGRVAAVASPLQGADSADAVARVRDTVLGRAILALLGTALTTDPSGARLVHSDIEVLDDLQTGSEVVRSVHEAWQRYRRDPYASPLATGTEVLTIGSMLDPVVNEHRTGLPGADHETILDANPIDAHGGSTTDARSQELLAAFLGGEPLPARGLSEHLVNRLAPVGSGLVEALEHRLAFGVWTASWAVGLS